MIVVNVETIYVFLIAPAPRVIRCPTWRWKIIISFNLFSQLKIQYFFVLIKGIQILNLSCLLSIYRHLFYFFLFFFFRLFSLGFILFLLWILLLFIEGVLLLIFLFLWFLFVAAHFISGRLRLIIFTYFQFLYFCYWTCLLSIYIIFSYITLKLI